MTIEYRETVYGKPHGEPKVAEPGKQDYMTIIPFSITGAAFIERIFVESKDVLRAGLFLTPYKRERINQANLQSSPFASLTDLLLWRRRYYSWRDDSNTPSAS